MPIDITIEETRVRLPKVPGIFIAAFIHSFISSVCLFNNQSISKVICVKLGRYTGIYTVYIMVKVWSWLTFASMLFTLDYDDVGVFSDKVP